MQKSRKKTQAKSKLKWGRRDSNPHGLPHMILNHARLPIPTLPRDQNAILMLSDLLKSSQKSSQSSQLCSQTSEWIDKFIVSRPPGTSQNTILFYHRTLKKLATYELTSENISDFLFNLPCGNGKKNYYVAIRALCNWLHKTGNIESNPIKLIDPPKTRRKLLTSPTDKQVDNIIRSTELPHEKCLVALAFSSGLRLSELSRIEVAD